MQTNKEIALAYLEHFCAGAIDRLEPLLASNLNFRGTLYSFESASEYLASLSADPPEKCQYNILSITENADSVALFYDYIKPNGIMQIAQLLTISGQRICKILLIFDSACIDKSYSTEILFKRK